jgi:hypothetical protein
VSEWPRRTRTTLDYRNQGDEVSVVDSVAGSEGSKSLDARKLCRDVILAKHEFAMIEREAELDTQRRQITLTECDERAGLSERSPSTSRASSMRSGGKSTIHDKQRSPHQDSPDRDKFLRTDFAEVIEGDEGRSVPVNDVSIEQQYFSPKGASLGGSPVFLSPAQHELAIDRL